MESNSLYYGNIVKLVSPNTNLDNNLFFIDYIDDVKLILISENLKKYTFILNKEKQFDEIEKIIVMNDSKNGYAKINKLLPGTLVKIHFFINMLNTSNTSFIQGVVTF